MSSSVSSPHPNVEQVTKLIEKSFEKVFSTMLKTPITLKGRFTSLELKDNHSPFYKLGSTDPLIAGSAGFIGSANGMIYQYMHQDLGLAIAGLMTGMSIPEIRVEGEVEIVDDVVGELTNMIVGTFKNFLCDLGYDCKVTLPSVLRGNRLGVNSMDSIERYLFQFEFVRQTVVADLFIESFEK